MRKIFFLYLGRAAAPKRKRGASSGYSLQVLAAVVPPLLWAFHYYPSRWLTPIYPSGRCNTMLIAAGKKVQSCTLLPIAQIAAKSPRHLHCVKGRGLQRKAGLPLLGLGSVAAAPHYFFKTK